MRMVAAGGHSGAVLGGLRRHGPGIHVQLGALECTFRHLYHTLCTDMRQHHAGGGKPVQREHQHEKPEECLAQRGGHAEIIGIRAPPRLICRLRSLGIGPTSHS